MVHEGKGILGVSVSNSFFKAEVGGWDPKSWTNPIKETGGELNEPLI